MLLSPRARMSTQLTNRRIFTRSNLALNGLQKLAPPDSALLAGSLYHGASPHIFEFSARCHSTIPGEMAPSSGKNQREVTLQHVRSFRLVGSLIPQLSGIPNTMFTEVYHFWPEMRRRYGDFYTMGSPAIGRKDDPYFCVHVVCDPREFVSVVKAGGSYPSGLVENLWTLRKWNETRNIPVKGLLSRGEEWKRLRTFMQKDLLHPESARGFVPGMILAGELASPGAQASRHNLNEYLRRCAFDFFASAMFGEMTQVSDPNTPTDPDNEFFVTRAAAGVSSSIEMLTSPYETVMYAMGLTTAKLNFCFDAMDDAHKIGIQKIQDFTERKAAGNLTIHEENSYLSRALDRQLETDSSVTIQEVQELVFVGLTAAVDTTSSVMGWNLFHIARHPEIQEKLHQELKQSVEKFGQDGRLTLEALSRDNVPYLHAILRETNRLTPATASAAVKDVDTDNIVIFNKKMEKGDVVLLDMFSLGMDPDLMDDPEAFIPDRWLPDAVESRKGTYREIVDHPYLKDPFSQGARKCPGSRVAMNEIQVLMAQLFLDWKVTSPATEMKDITYAQKTAVELDVPVLDFEARK